MTLHLPACSRTLRGMATSALALMVGSAALAQAPERHAFFGETHVHTSWSFDAYIFGNHVTGPADAYRYAKGETIPHPLGYDVRITTPLDWMGVTDHSEYAGVVRLSNDPTSPISKLPVASQLKVRDAADIQRIYLWLGTSMIEMKPVEALVQPDISDTVWKANNDAANAANEPGKFTAFCSYEWTSNPDFRNMHRNVFFKDCAKVPDRPFSSLQSQAPEDLWAWMDEQRQAGNELLAISHNANLSGGLMYPTEVDFKGRPIDQAWADARDRNERLTEIKQIKGQSETHPLLSPNDEFASFEVLNYLLGDPQGQFVTLGGSYIRQALKDYVLFPALTGPLLPLTLAGNATANLIRNIWAFNIIFCGHFPSGVETFTEEECQDENGEESRGHWYYRQLLGSANITGGKLFHIMTGNLSHQIEHHLFPDLPARRYPEVAGEIREICRRYGLDYNTGPLRKQLGSVARKIFRLALPPRREQSPEPVAERPDPSQPTTRAA